MFSAGEGGEPSRHEGRAVVGHHPFDVDILLREPFHGPFQEGTGRLVNDLPSFLLLHALPPSSLQEGGFLTDQMGDFRKNR
jgi:hypothetical protein